MIILPLRLMLGVLTAIGLAAPLFAQTPLGLDESVTIAVQANDPSVAVFEQRALALEQRAIAERQLPDPVFSTQIQNLPLSSFDLNREAMTQLSFGVRQAFPKGNSRTLTAEKRIAEMTAEHGNKALRIREIILQTRISWLELYYWKQAGKFTHRTQVKVQELAKISEVNFANGQGNLQTILRIELESALLATKRVELDRKADTKIADLARMVGIANAARQFPNDLPKLPAMPSVKVVQDGLINHPSVSIFDAKINGRGLDVKLAQQQYRPGFSIDATYGLRDSRSDFGSIGVSYSIPLFTKNRQDRDLRAAKHMLAASQLARDGQLLELNRWLGRDYSTWLRISKRIALYEKDVMFRAKEVATAALAAFETDANGFAELVRAELMVLETELTLTRLQVDRAKAHVRLMFLAGEGDE